MITALVSGTVAIPLKMHSYQDGRPAAVAKSQRVPRHPWQPVSKKDIGKGIATVLDTAVTS